LRLKRNGAFIIMLLLESAPVAAAKKQVRVKRSSMLNVNITRLEEAEADDFICV